MSLVTRLKNNWKKATFASAVFCYGIYSFKTHFEISKHMRAICKEVTTYGNQSSPPKHVLVIMNPVANKKKAEKTFKKYCEPILHLAGYSINIVKTNYVGHAKSVIEDMKVLPDAIVIAGGDGTSSEVVTGLLRRHDAPCPIVLLPLGRKNESALKYSKRPVIDDLSLVQSISDTLLAMIREKFRLENVIKFDVIETTESNFNKKNLKPIYGLHEFSWGVLRDIESVKDKYWYFGNLRYYAAALFNAFSSNLNWNLSASYIYTPPCPGCTNCYIEKINTKNNTPKSILSNFLPKTKSEEAIVKHYKTNENCLIKIDGNVATNQLKINCHCNTDAFYELETKFYNNLNPGFDFIKNLVDVTQNTLVPTMAFKSRTIQLIPTKGFENNAFYSIDGEEYDVRPIKVTIIPDAIKLFC